MSNQEIVQKLWNECNVLRDDGVSYQDYITELTYILFLKMSKEQGQEDDIPEKYQWDNLVSKEGLELKNFYRQLLLDLGNPEIVKSERINAIYANASKNTKQRWRDLLRSCTHQNEISQAMARIFVRDFDKLEGELQAIMNKFKIVAKEVDDEV